MKPPRVVRRPWELPHGFPNSEWTSEIAAMQALERGEADEFQQRAAWKFILNTLCRVDDMSFQPGAEGAERATSFAEGVRWVGRQMRVIARLVPKGASERGEPPPMPGQKPE